MYPTATPRTVVVVGEAERVADQPVDGRLVAVRIHAACPPQLAQVLRDAGQWREPTGRTVQGQPKSGNSGWWVGGVRERSVGATGHQKGAAASCPRP